MHIMEGFLPHPWWEIWFALSLPVLAYGVYKMNRMIKESRETLPLLAVAGAFVFVLSSLKLPSVTGSCSHPTGTGMGAIIFGPAITSVLAVIVLVYLSVFLAATLADWATYLVTAAQLALAFPAASGGVYASFEAFAAVFAITQVPLAAVEGAVTALMFKYIVQLRSDVLVRMNVVSEKAVARLREVAA